ncbi:hypothetical protein FRC10_012292 [Ceratobasidium sp. 414]|nr:hypothetical protein FRC10_012292 [Ceratobasidium sp. 414]
MPSVVISALAVTVAALGILYQAYLSPLLVVGGAFRSVEPLNTDQRRAVEEFVIHSSGLLYLACTPSPWNRVEWGPGGEHFNATAFRARSDPDYVATYNPRSGEITKLQLSNFMEPRGLSLQGMDVVPDEHDADLLWVYLVNHRPPLDPAVDAAKVGADSVIEIFKTRVGTRTMEWVKTVEDPSVIVTPNDVIGGANGQEFWFTNDNAVKVGLARPLHLLFRVKSTWVGYCHVDAGCKVAADELYFSNGIVRTMIQANDGTVWVGSSGSGDITVHEQQADKTLVVTEVIKTGRPIDNLSLAPDGSVIAATLPKGLQFISQSAKDPSIPSPASAHRISINKDHSSYFGEKYKVEKVCPNGFMAPATC